MDDWFLAGNDLDPTSDFIGTPHIVILDLMADRTQIGILT